MKEVIIDNPASSRRETRLKIRSVLREIYISKDIIVATLKDVKEWSNVPLAFISTVIKIF